MIPSHWQGIITAGDFIRQHTNCVVLATCFPSSWTVGIPGGRSCCPCVLLTELMGWCAAPYFLFIALRIFFWISNYIKIQKYRDFHFARSLNSMEMFVPSYFLLDVFSNEFSSPKGGRDFRVNARDQVRSPFHAVVLREEPPFFLRKEAVSSIRGRTPLFSPPGVTTRQCTHFRNRLPRLEVVFFTSWSCKNTTNVANSFFATLISWSL